MSLLIVFVLVVLAGFIAWLLIRLAVWYRILTDDQRAVEAARRKSDDAYAQWEATDQELRFLEYAALYERWEEDRLVRYRLGTSIEVVSTLPQAVFMGTSVINPLHSSAAMYPGRGSGRPWNDVPTPRTIRIVPEEVPGAD